MKIYLIIAFFTFSVSSLVDASDGSMFVQQIDSLWKNKNYNQIIQLATTEAAKQPPLREAYVIQFGYHLVITADQERAIQALDDLLNVLDGVSQTKFQTVTEFKNEFIQVSEGQPQPPTSTELDSLHQLFPDHFPVQSLLILISGMD